MLFRSLVRKDRAKFTPNKSKNFHNKNKNFNNKRGQQEKEYVLVHHEEWDSDASDDDEEGGDATVVAAIATASTSSSSTAPTTSTSTVSLFDSPNENIIKPTCLMAKASLVTSSSSHASTLSSSNDKSSLKVKQEIVELSKFLETMEGSTKVHVETFMNQLGATHERSEERRVGKECRL